MSGILLALIAAVSWGSIVLVSNKLGGDENSQTIGTTLGALLFSIFIFIFVQPDLSLLVCSVGFISGLFWSIYYCFVYRMKKSASFIEDVLFVSPV
ncbi:hypothetical protein CVD25_02245 [Bacillus canaveralius]|uniref:EamA domain-containing protein n=1 Tax=Bacillus canaveralius TaxID=1403243 RepID=A0A2N5GPB4_9BACI|nr:MULTISPECIES: GRP family sugar transporter [Bacillus]PLR84407.1 hypothetical protein CU635_06550 [Bacillus canaveralius]PLR87009.1 hypothetical protein CVD23_05080 [Bacillus sp. V33-4]PLS00591.1 hypothetical protein CVD25_02245 [Bacillus canaveralius]RSK57876.1 hypothetical protein EJA13_00455 [Bacillus canaveralius]